MSQFVDHLVEEYGLDSGFLRHYYFSSRTKVNPEAGEARRSCSPQRAQVARTPAPPPYTPCTPPPRIVQSRVHTQQKHVKVNLSHIWVS